MLKQKLILTATFITGCCLLGCSAVPKARITNVDSYTVAQAFYENGTRQTETTATDFLGGIISLAFPFSNRDPNAYVTHRRVWPEPAIIHNNQKLTIKYDLSKSMWGDYRCKDMITLIVQDPNDTVLSIKSQKKDVDTFDPLLGLIWFVESLNPFYKRDCEREQMIMIKTARQLQTEHQASIEWLGKWRPDLNNP